MKLFDLLFGGYIVSAEERDRLRVLALWMHLSIPARELTRNRWRLPVYRCRRVIEQAKALGIPLTVEGRYGLPARLSRGIRRGGTVVGLLLAVLLVTLLSSLVWRVEVVGNETVGTEEILAALSEVGLEVGAFRRAVDVNLVESELQLAMDEISWVSIYMRGCVAEVKVKERETATLPDGELPPSNLVASTDAVVREIHTVHGTTVTVRGAVVKRGELLISGIVEGAHADRLLSAEGSVIGEVGSEIVVRIPYAQTENRPVSQKIGAKQIIFFGKTINISRNTGNSAASYGTIIEERNLFLPGRIPLPVCLRSYRLVEYEAVEVTLTPEDAEAYATATLNRRIAETVGEGTLVAKQIEKQTDAEGCTLRCRIVYTTDIAERREIELG